jgi:V-type H+-transporting ATPase subunit H
LLNFKIHHLCDTLSQRKWTDEEIVEDLEYLKENLEAACQDLTTWDEYRAELESGILEWSPPHNSPHFWKENASKLEDENNELLKLVLDILFHRLLLILFLAF